MPKVISEYITLDSEWERYKNGKGQKYPNSFYLYLSSFFPPLEHTSINLLFSHKFIWLSTATFYELSDEEMKIQLLWFWNASSLTLIMIPKLTVEFRI